MSFPEMLKTLRSHNSISQQALANDLKITDRAIRKYESGESQPTLPVLIALADYFDVPLDYLVGRTDDPKR